ncbi:MAG: hypothetical protein K0A98_01935 [Trueperaceae bacterium]|nr:hypothetical protein [Trueperaceae bacterium]
MGGQLDVGLEAGVGGRTAALAGDLGEGLNADVSHADDLVGVRRRDDGAGVRPVVAVGGDDAAAGVERALELVAQHGVRGRPCPPDVVDPTCGLIQQRLVGRRVARLLDEWLREARDRDRIDEVDDDALPIAVVARVEPLPDHRVQLGRVELGEVLWRVLAAEGHERLGVVRDLRGVVAHGRGVLDEGGVQLAGRVLAVARPGRRRHHADDGGRVPVRAGHAGDRHPEGWVRARRTRTFGGPRPAASKRARVRHVTPQRFSTSKARCETGPGDARVRSPAGQTRQSGRGAAAATVVDCRYDFLLAPFSTRVK